MPDRYAYADLTELKSAGWLDLTGTTLDIYLLALLETASGLLDRKSNRQFQPKTETRYFNGENGAQALWLPDLLSVTTLRTDEDGDATYERTWAATDYILWPYVGFPKLKVEADQRNPSGKFSFPRGQRAIELNGLWGYGNGDSATPYEDSGTTVTASNATTTSVTAADGAKLAIGQTILVESEQMFITNIVTNALTVVRAVNGTTGAAHTTQTANIYRYPAQVKTAALVLTAELWKAKDSAFASVIGLPEIGLTQISPAFNQKALSLMIPFVRREVVAV